MKALGRHILVEFLNCKADVLNDVAAIENAMVQAAQIAGATVINSTFHHFSPYGVSGVVVRLGKAFAKVEAAGDLDLNCGGGASGILVSSTARDNGIAGLEFLRSIPGTVGGFVRMNGGAYGGEV